MTRAPLALTEPEVATQLRALGVPDRLIEAALARHAPQRLAPAPAARPVPPHARPATVTAWCLHMGLPAPTFEYRFHTTRKWMFDWSWPKLFVAVEIEGIDHRRRERYAKDLAKYNEAILSDWIVLRQTPKQAFYQSTATMIRQAMLLQQRRAQHEALRVDKELLDAWSGAGKESRQQMREILDRSSRVVMGRAARDFIADKYGERSDDCAG